MSALSPLSYGNVPSSAIHILASLFNTLNTVLYLAIAYYLGLVRNIYDDNDYD